MPMVWNAEADAKLLSAIIKVYNVKVSGDNLNEVAALMGPECTPKACTHRLAKIRDLAKGDGTTTGSTGTPKSTKPGTPVKPKATPNKKTTGGRNNHNSSDVSDDEERGAVIATVRSKRTTPKRNYAELNGGDNNSDSDSASDSDAYGEEGRSANKKVKIEQTEGGGEGLRTTEPSGVDDEKDFTF